MSHPGKTLAIAVILLSSLASFAQGLGPQARQESEIPAEVEDMYQRGLRRLAQTQQKNGSWGKADDNYGGMPGVVGMALMAFLAHGDDPNFGEYSSNIQKATTFILSQAKPDGFLGKDDHGSMYSHGFATLALAEAYGAVDNPGIGMALDKAVKLILKSQEQNPRKAWRYSVNDNTADTSVSGAILMALLSARNAGGSVPDSSVDDALKFMLSCHNPTDGGFGYTSPGGSNYPRTGIGVLMLTLAGRDKAPERMAGIRYIMSNVSDRDDNYPFYARYYCSQAIFHADKAMWEKWNSMNIAELKTLQLKDGGWNSQFGPCCATSFSLLSLALNYRFLPVYERNLPGERLRLIR